MNPFSLSQGNEFYPCVNCMDPKFANPNCPSFRVDVAPLNLPAAFAIGFVSSQPTSRSKLAGSP